MADLTAPSESWDGARLGPLAWAAAPPESPGAHARTSLPGSVFKDDAFRLPSCHQGPPVDDELMPRGRQEQGFLDPTSKQGNHRAVTAPPRPPKDEEDSN